MKLWQTLLKFFFKKLTSSHQVAEPHAYIASMVEGGKKMVLGWSQENRMESGT